MAGAKRARQAEAPKQPSLCLKLRALFFYPTQSPKSTRPSTTCLCPGRPGHWNYATTSQARCRSVARSRDDWTPCSEAYFACPLARGTTGKQCGLTATGVYQPSLCSPWLAATVSTSPIYPFCLKGKGMPGTTQYDETIRRAPKSWWMAS